VSRWRTGPSTTPNGAAEWTWNVPVAGFEEIFILGGVAAGAPMPYAIALVTKGFHIPTD